MALIHSLECEGKWLFKYRGQIPVFLFIAVIPVIWCTNYSDFPSLETMIILCIGIFVSSLGQGLRAYTVGTTPAGTSGRNTKEQVAEELNQSGIYSIVRHPLYLANYLMWIGIVISVMNAGFLIIVSLAYWLYYERIMFTEERFLERKFGQQYINWSLKVPAFLPSFASVLPAKEKFNLKAILRREYSGFYATVIGFLFVQYLIEAKSGHWMPSRQVIIVFSVATVLTLLLRLLKRKTILLNDYSIV